MGAGLSPGLPPLLTLSGAVLSWRDRSCWCLAARQGLPLQTLAPESSGMWVEEAERGLLVWCGLERGKKTVNQKSLESPQRSTQFLQSFRWKPVTEMDCLRRRSCLPSC